MVILNSVMKTERFHPAEFDKTHQYVYLIDDAQKMMVIIKRDFKEMNENSVTEEKTVKDCITRQIEGLLDKINNNGPLSFRETQLLKYAALGESNKRIAKTIDRSECTVKNHFSRIMKKLHANDRTHAVALALCNGWIPGLPCKKQGVDMVDNNYGINKSEIKKKIIS